jgi:xanthine dehydrogenase YagS FAD-binding subunit
LSIMMPFAYEAISDVRAAIARVRETQGAHFIAGGTDMLQLLQDGVIAPAEIVDINAVPLDRIDISPTGAHIGALARMADVADHPGIRDQFPAVSESLLASASAQVRNMASIGGNLVQRTRCLYFRDATMPCNKRVPGSGCSAQDGENRLNAILGVSRDCIATYAGDLAVALVVLDASVQVDGERGFRTIPIEQFHRIPTDTPHIETVLDPGDLIVSVAIPTSDMAKQSHYFKVRDRTSFEFALASAAVALDTHHRIVHDARVAVGGVATKPWRLFEVEESLIGLTATPDVFHAASMRAGAGAVTTSRNAFKLPLMQRTVERALNTLGARI